MPPKKLANKIATSNASDLNTNLVTILNNTFEKRATKKNKDDSDDDEDFEDSDDENSESDDENSDDGSNASDIENETSDIENDDEAENDDDEAENEETEEKDDIEDDDVIDADEGDDAEEGDVDEEAGEIDIAGCLIDEEYEDVTDEITEVPKEKRLSFPKLTKYERVRILSTRTKQLALGAPPFVKNINLDDMSPSEIAEIELKMNMIPFIIERFMPDNTYEVWHLKELEK